MRLIVLRYLAGILTLAQLVACFAIAQKTGDKALKELLSKQGFTGELKGKVNFDSLGSLQCNADKLQVFYYEWEESHPPGFAIHASYRVIFIGKGNRYLGSYAVEDQPKIVGSLALIFDYPAKLGNTIRCDPSGLPKSVLLDGELPELEK